MCGGIPAPPIEGSSRHRGSRSDCDRRDPRSRAGGSVIEIATRSRVGRSCDGGIPCRPETGSCFFMEVNGRYWGTSSLPILAGVDFPLYHWQILHGEQPHVSGEYAIGMRWRWTPGYLDRLYSIMARSSGKIVRHTSRIRELVQIPIDFLPPIREALWTWSDPEPFFSELAASIFEHLTAAVNWLLRKLTRGGTSRYAKIYLRLRPEARSTYARLRTADALGTNRKYSQAIPGSMRSALFVCY